MLHVKLPDVRIPEIFLVALQILFTHLVRIDEMNLCILHMDIVLKMGKNNCPSCITRKHSCVIPGLHAPLRYFSNQFQWQLI